MKIREVCNRVGINSDNIRFYEREGLIHPIRDEGNNYREYSEEDVALLEKIKLLRSLGIPIADIRQIIDGEVTLEDAAGRRLEEIEREKTNLELVRRVCTSLVRSGTEFGQLDAENIISTEPGLTGRINDILNKDTAMVEMPVREFDKTVAMIMCAGYLVSALILLLLGLVIGSDGEELFKSSHADTSVRVFIALYAAVSFLLCFLQLWSSKIRVQAAGTVLSMLTVGPGLWGLLALCGFNTNNGISILIMQTLFILVMHIMRGRSSAFADTMVRPLLLSIIFCGLMTGLIIIKCGASLASCILSVLIGICILISGMGWTTNGSSGRRLTMFDAVVTASRMLAAGTVMIHYYGNQNSWRRTPDEPKWFKG